jgi:hypothetical protein
VKTALKIILLVTLWVMSGCGINMPERTKKAVLPKDVIGEWKYPLTTDSGEAHIIFHEDGRYDLIIANTHAGWTTSKQGRWTLEQADLVLTPFYCLTFVEPTKLEQYQAISWFFTETDQHTLALFGGDSFDADNWLILSRVK